MKITDIKVFQYNGFYMVDTYVARGPFLIAITYPYKKEKDVKRALKALGESKEAPKPDATPFVFFMGKNNTRVR